MAGDLRGVGSGAFPVASCIPVGRGGLAHWGTGKIDDGSCMWSQSGDSCALLGRFFCVSLACCREKYYYVLGSQTDMVWKQRGKNYSKPEQSVPHPAPLLRQGMGR